jgi:hypothetical protein
VSGLVVALIGVGVALFIMADIALLYGFWMWFGGYGVIAWAILNASSGSHVRIER